MKTVTAQPLRGEAGLFSIVLFTRRTTPWQAIDMKFYYVYMIRSLRNPERYYVGMSDNLVDRLKSHNSGLCKYAAKFVPWYVETAIAFRSKERAVAFEKYLKSHSGRAFAEKHF